MKEKYIVLSYGRSGSTILAVHLANKYLTGVRYVKSIDDLDINSNQVYHTHLTYITQKNIMERHRIFSLRQDPVETVLSWICVNHYGQYHRLSTDNIQNQTFEFWDYKFIDSVCRGYCRWHEHYSPGLKNTDQVIFYEDTVKYMFVPESGMQPIYPNKTKLILNYDWVLSKILKHRSALVRCQRKFVSHQIQHFADPYWLKTLDRDHDQALIPTGF